MANGLHLGKIEKSPYLSKGMTDRRKNWQDDAFWPSWSYGPTVPTISIFWRSKMAAAAILKNRNIAISRQRFDRSSWNLAPWRTLILLTLFKVKIQILQIHDSGGRHLKNRKNCHISQTVWPISTKFGTVTWRMLVLLALLTVKNPNFENPRWRQPPQSKNRHISATVWPIATKFGIVTHVDPLDPSDR